MSRCNPPGPKFLKSFNRSIEADNVRCNSLQVCSGSVSASSDQLPYAIFPILAQTEPIVVNDNTGVPLEFSAPSINTYPAGQAPTVSGSNFIDIPPGHYKITGVVLGQKQGSPPPTSELQIMAVTTLVGLQIGGSSNATQLSASANDYTPQHTFQVTIPGPGVQTLVPVAGSLMNDAANGASILVVGGFFSITRLSDTTS